METIILKVKENTQGTKTVTIPKKCKINGGDLIKLIKMKVTEE